MKICNICKNVIADDDVRYKKSFIGEYGNGKIYHREMQTCHCGGDFVDAIQCVECDDFFEESECIHDGFPICKKCFEKNATPSMAIEYAEYDGFGTDDVKINPFIAYCLSEREINEILKNEIRKNPKAFEKNAKEFCLDDPFFFSEFLKKRSDKK